MSIFVQIFLVGYVKRIFSARVRSFWALKVIQCHCFWYLYRTRVCDFLFFSPT